MVAAKLGIYYTFKIMEEQPLRVHALKWEEFGDVPIETYKIEPENPSAMGGCSCPAWTRECKHMRCVQEARKDGKINELYRWKWSEKGGWERVSDILSIEEMDIG